jgi:hypothetical protein
MVPMRLKRTLVVGGLIAALAGGTAVVAAERLPVHVMTVQLPGGGIEQIHYVGDTPPRILVADTAETASAPSLFDVAFGPGSPFADMDRISAEMDQQMAAMMHQASLAQAATADGQLQPAAAASAPAGATSITTVSTSNAKGVCTQSVRTVSMGEGKAPQVTRTSSGACDATPAAAAKPATPTPPVAPPKPEPIDRDTI